MSKYDLLNKTELSIDGILLENANLIQIARTVAEVLGIDRSDLLVTDVGAKISCSTFSKRGSIRKTSLAKKGNCCNPCPSCQACKCGKRQGLILGDC